MSRVIQIPSAKHYRGSIPAAGLYYMCTIRGAQAGWRLRGRVAGESACLSRVNFEIPFFASRSLLRN